MDLSEIINGLREERELIEQAIASFERLVAGQGRRRGRPPAWLRRIEYATAGADAPKRRRGQPAKNKEVQ